jgi:hypothetical protein
MLAGAHNLSPAKTSSLAKLNCNLLSHCLPRTLVCNFQSLPIEAAHLNVPLLSVSGFSMFSSNAITKLSPTASFALLAVSAIIPVML